MSEQQSADSTSAEELQLASYLRDKIARFYARLSALIDSSGCGREPESLFHVLVLAVKDGDAEVQKQALRFFESLNEEAPQLDDRLQRAAAKRPFPRKMVGGKMQFVSRSGPHLATTISQYYDRCGLVAALCSAIDAQDPGIAALAQEAMLPLVNYQSEFRTVRSLCNALQRPDLPRKLELIRALRRCDPARAAMAVSILAQILTTGKTEEIRIAAAATLEHFGIEARPAISKLLAVMADDQAADEFRHAAAGALVACTPLVIHLQPAKSLAEDDRKRVFDALCAIGSYASKVRQQFHDVWCSTSNPPGGGKAPGKKKRGGRQKYDPKKDAEVAVVLRQLGGDTKKAAKEMKMRVKDVKLAQDRHRKRPPKPNR